MLQGMSKNTCGIPKGARVEIHPSFDLWMRGAKYGTVVRCVKSGKRAGKVAVKMDHPQVRKLLYAKPEDLTVRR